MFCLSYPEKIKLQALRCLRDWRQMDNVLCDLFRTEDRRVYEKKAQILLDLAFGELLEKQASYLFGNLYKQGVRFNPKKLSKNWKNVLDTLGITEAEEAAQSVSRGAQSASKGMGGKDVGGGKAAPTKSEPSTTPQPGVPEATPPRTVPSESELPPGAPASQPSGAWSEGARSIPLSDASTKTQIPSTGAKLPGAGPAGGARSIPLSDVPFNPQVPSTGAKPLLHIGPIDSIIHRLQNLPEGERQEVMNQILDKTHRLNKGIQGLQQALSEKGESSFSILRSPLFWGPLTGLGGFGAGYYLRNSGNQNVSSQNVSSLDTHKVLGALELIRNYNRQHGYRMEPEEEGRLMDYLLYLVRRNPGISIEELYNRFRRNAEPIRTSQK
jgi:hypothetical protein